MTITRLPAELISVPGLGAARGTPLLRRHPAVALVQVVHREVDAGQVAARSGQVTGNARADRHDHRVVLGGQVGGRDVATDVLVIDEADPLLLEDVDPAVDDPLLELGVRDAEPHQAARALVALVHGDLVAALIELGGHRQTGRAGADHGDRLAGAAARWVGHHPPLLERPLGDRHLDLLDRHRVVVDRQHAGRLTRGRTYPAGELGKVVGGVELVDRLVPLVPIDEVVPVRDQVAERAALVAERDAAVHAPRALPPQLLRRLKVEVLPVIVHALLGIALVEADPMDLQERAELSHGYSPAPGTAVATGIVPPAASASRSTRSRSARL